MVLYNNHAHYLYLIGPEGNVIIRPWLVMDLPIYFTRYVPLYLSTTPDDPDPYVYTPWPIGTAVEVHSRSEIDGEVGTVVGKDQMNYFVNLGTVGSIWFPYSEVGEYHGS